MYEKLSVLIYALERSRMLSSIKRGFVIIIPVIMTGAAALLLRSFPVPAFQEVLRTAFDGNLLLILDCIYNATFGCISVYVVFSISYYYASTFESKNLPLRIAAVLVSFACFMIGFGAEQGDLMLSDLGSTRVFPAMLSAIVATRVFFAVWRFLAGRYHSYEAGADLNYKSAVSAILPMMVCILGFVLLNLVLQLCFHVGDVNRLIAEGMNYPFELIKGDFAQGALFLFLLNFQWLFGIHGGNVMEQVARSIFVPANSNPELIVSKSFMDVFALMGGCGGTICLLLALLLFSRRKDSRRIAYSALPFALFNINDILIFGLPVVLNPIMALPFILVPLITMSTAYFFTVVGFIPLVTDTVTWTTPVLFSGYVATHSVSGVVVQLINIGLGTMIYAPFVKLSERLREEDELKWMDELTEEYRICERSGEEHSFLLRQDLVGMAAKAMVGQLRSDIGKDLIPVQYQPQMNGDGTLFGAEALLRWSYGGKTLYPPLVIGLAQEDRSYDPLTRCIFLQVCRDTKFLKEKVCGKIQISVNISAAQLGNGAFIREVVRVAREEGVSENLGLEVTEETSVTDLGQVEANIRYLSENGISVAIDDFSMGQTSLKYLQNNAFAFVKLDGELVRQIGRNARCREIIRSIISLGRELDYKIIAEYVEDELIRDELQSLGCDYYQGYLYGKAVSAKEFAERFGK